MTNRLSADTVLRALIPVLCRVCEREHLDVTPDMRLEDIPGIDSLRILEAVALLEEHFGVEVDVVALDDLGLVQHILNAIVGAQPMPVIPVI